MSERIDYAEMLEIPVSTVNVVRKKSKKKRAETDDLKDQVVKAVNERVSEGDFSEEKSEEVLSETRYAASEDLSEEYDLEEPDAAPVKVKGKFFDSKILLAQFVAVLALAATIFLTNIVWKESAINTFFAGLLNPTDQSQSVDDDRIYSQLTMGSVVSDDDITCTVSDTGVLSFTGECSVYTPCDGKIVSVTEKDGLYTVKIEHTKSFSTEISNLSTAYFAAGDKVFSTIPVGYTKGASPVSVSMFDNGNLIKSYTVNEANDIIWNV